MLPRIRRLLLLALLITLLPAVPRRDVVLAQSSGPPIAVSFVRDGDAAVAGEPVTFAIAVPQAGTTYVWQFGDGTPPAPGMRVAHTYARVGDFRVRVVAQTGTGGAPRDLGSRVVRVTPEFRGVFAADLDG